MKKKKFLTFLLGIIFGLILAVVREMQVIYHYHKIDEGRAWWDYMHTQSVKACELWQEIKDDVKHLIFG